MNNTISGSRVNVRRIAIAGVLSALSIVLNFMPQIGFIYVPFLQIQITTMHLPVIIGAILEGPVVGALVGLVFGLMSLYTASVSPLPIAFAFLNPLVSVLPRILIGVVAYYTYRLAAKVFKEKRRGVAIGIGAVLGTITNTVGVLGMIYILYAQRYIEALGEGGKAPLAVLFGGTLINVTAEVVLAVLLTVPVVLSLSRVVKRRV